MPNEVPYADIRYHVIVTSVLLWRYILIPAFYSKNLKGEHFN